MATHYDATEYLYASTRARALETKIIGRDRLSRLIEAKDLDDLRSVLAEFGISDDNRADGASVEALSIEELLSERLVSAYDEVAKMSEENDPVRFLRYQYDCNNIKAAIKCFERSISPESMLIPLGTLEGDDVVSWVKRGDYSEFPENMARAAGEAVSEYKKTGDVQIIDFLIDRACYADMLSEAKRSGIEFAEKLVRAKIDLTNLMICVRVIRMNIGIRTRKVLEESLIAGGEIEISTLIDETLVSEEKLFSLIEFSPLEKLIKFSGGERGLASLEKAADDYWLELVKSAKFVPYGAEVLIAFIIAHEYEVKNIRIILAAKKAGLSPDTIRERMRDSYV